MRRGRRTPRVRGRKTKRGGFAIGPLLSMFAPVAGKFLGGLFGGNKGDGLARAMGRRSRKSRLRRK